MHERFVCVLFFWLPVLRAQSINTDRPTNREFGRGACGSFQWECGFSSTWHPGFGGNIQELWPCPIRCSGELSRGFELEGGPSASTESHCLGEDDVWPRYERCADRHQDPALAARREQTEVAYLGHAVVLPLVIRGSRGFDWGMVNKLCISHDRWAGWALGYNLGYDLADGRGSFTYATGGGQGHQ